MTRGRTGRKMDLAFCNMIRWTLNPSDAIPVCNMGIWKAPSRKTQYTGVDAEMGNRGAKTTPLGSPEGIMNGLAQRNIVRVDVGTSPKRQLHSFSERCSHYSTGTKCGGRSNTFLQDIYFAGTGEQRQTNLLEKKKTTTNSKLMHGAAICNKYTWV
jgi:hypothetical protein